MRSAFETYIDLKCLVDDPSYLGIMHQAQRKEEDRYYKHYSQENPYYGSLTKIELANIREKISQDYDKSSILKICEKFEKAKELNVYRTIYNNLCLFTHGNITALESKYFDNGKICFSTKATDIELNFILSSTINLAIASTIELVAYFGFDERKINSFKDIITNNKAFAKSHV